MTTQELQEKLISFSPFVTIVEKDKEATELSFTEDMVIVNGVPHGKYEILDEEKYFNIVTPDIIYPYEGFEFVFKKEIESKPYYFNFNERRRKMIAKDGLTYNRHVIFKPKGMPLDENRESDKPQ